MTFHPATPRLNACRRAPLFVPRKIIHGRIPSPPRAYELAERLCALQVRANEHDCIISRALLLELLLELLDTRTRNAADVSHDTNLAQRVRDLLEQNLGQHGNLRIPDLMESHLRYSYAHLCRVFRAKYGIPPLKYLNAVCISRAKLLLRDTDLPVAVMAQRLGFRDPLYFSQLFRKTSGLSPSQYRLQIQT
jgi:AraC-like DNA-binding protein